MGKQMVGGIVFDKHDFQFTLNVIWFALKSLKKFPARFARSDFTINKLVFYC